MNSSSGGRALVLCFDGTGNKYNRQNTNIVRLFSLLKKDEDDKQLVYYQTGIGTYAAPGIYNRVARKIATTLDNLVASFLQEHVQAGYEFLVNNYRKGDRIALFGFSRGAYIARALAGMIYKVGLIPKDNREMVPFAYALYKDSDIDLAFDFRENFSRTVEIQFMGVWDTVSSVGFVIPRHLPFTQSNHIIRTFRHALSLDERRTMFKPNLWHRPAPNVEEARKDPEFGSGVAGQSSPKPKRLHLQGSWPFVQKDQEDPQDEKHKEEKKKDPRKETDVLEVWFAGMHSDVGGGNVDDDEPHALSAISLRWMIRECAQSQCGVQFDKAALRAAGIPASTFMSRNSPFNPLAGHRAGKCIDRETESSTLRVPSWHTSSPKPPREGLPSDPSPGEPAPSQPDGPNALGIRAHEHHELSPLPSHTSEDHVRMSDTKLDKEEALADMHDQIKKPQWWLLELLPLLNTYQDHQGKWHTKLRVNLFRGREVHNPRPIYVHKTVKHRMEQTDYKPKARWTGEAIWIE